MEDIIDTGLTITWLKNELQKHAPASIKPAQRGNPIYGRGREHQKPRKGAERTLQYTGALLRLAAYAMEPLCPAGKLRGF